MPEAQPAGGHIAISTHNQYVEASMQGYEEIKKGEYAVLEISDRGLGIAANDLDRIFEPFYTKKVMGRSGTGLGMAVVWGTAHDHDGYTIFAARRFLYRRDFPPNGTHTSSFICQRVPFFWS